VVVKVAVDSTGSVTDARLERGGSRYFGKLAVAAARKWTFPAGSSGPRLVRFEITRTETKAFVEKSGR
jgi:TonB family protein